MELSKEKGEMWPFQNTFFYHFINVYGIYKPKELYQEYNFLKLEITSCLNPGS